MGTPHPYYLSPGQGGDQSGPYAPPDITRFVTTGTGIYGRDQSGPYAPPVITCMDGESITPWSRLYAVFVPQRCFL
jgi:hypothetical protein